MKMNDYMKKAEKIIKKIEKKIPLSHEEIAVYIGTEVKIINNIFLMYENWGRRSIESITLDQEDISEIISLKYPRKGLVNSAPALK